MAVERFLISGNWRAREELVAELLQALSAHQGRVLDVRQSVIYGAISFGVLAEFPGSSDSGAAFRELLSVAAMRDAQLRIVPVDESGYQQWQATHNTVRHIITLISRQITPEQLAVVCSVATSAGLVLDGIRRLARNDQSAQRASVELSVRGTVPNQQSLRELLLQQTEGLAVDISVQVDDVYRRNRRLVAFDMDSTLIQAEVIDELAAYAGVKERVAAVTERAMAGELDFDASLRERVALLKGVDAQALESVAAAVPLSEGTERLVRNLKRLGYKTAILSGGFIQVANKLAQSLGIDYVHANSLRIADGKLTGELDGPIVNGERKAALLKDIAQREGLSLEQTIAVGDGANDLPMLGVAGLGIAYRAKPLVVESARHAISHFGLDGVLYFMGFSDDEIQ